MKDGVLIFSSLRARWLNSVLSVFLTAFGVMLALMVIQFGHHVQSRLGADGRGIDIVIGAKGSPLQLILSSVYHVDIPAGNIPYDTAEKWMKHPQVRAAIPLALGDNWRGYRIVGTNAAYMAHYDARIDAGRMWDKPFEAVAGASVGIAVGARFAGAHGLAGDGHVHGDSAYRVVGVMAPTGTVLDRLILTSLDSVLNIHGMAGVEFEVEEAVHEHDHSHDHHHSHNHNHDHEHEGRDHHHGDARTHGLKPEITAVLITTRSPVANMNLPRLINRESALQAANPAFEMARLTTMLGMGSQSFKALSAVLIIVSALSIFAGLAGSLENRAGDLAVLRAIGYSKGRLLRLIAAEGMMIVSCGVVIGVAMGAGGFMLMTRLVAPLAASGAQVAMTMDAVLMITAVFLAGLAASLVPAFFATRVDPVKQLSRGV